MRTLYSMPVIVALSVYVRFLTPGALVRVQLIVATKLPAKSVTGVLVAPVNVFAQGPTPSTTKDEPVAEKVRPAEIEPLVRAPVEKLTEPNEPPVAKPPQLLSCDPTEEMPAVDIETYPTHFIRSIPLAHA